MRRYGDYSQLHCFLAGKNKLNEADSNKKEGSSELRRGGASLRAFLIVREHLPPQHVSNHTLTHSLCQTHYNAVCNYWLKNIVYSYLSGKL
jgi:hypothetical protein